MCFLGHAWWLIIHIYVQFTYPSINPPKKQRPQPPIALVLQSPATYGPVFTLPWIGKCDMRFTQSDFAAGASCLDVGLKEMFV